MRSDALIVRLVLDTNTLISAILWRGTPAAVLAAVRAGQATVAISAEILEELAGVLERSKFRQRLIVTNLSAVAAYRQVVSVTQRVTAPPLASIAELRDPADAIILACAVAAGADAIVTGDQDLLVLGSFRRIPILTATQTVEKLKLR